MLVLGLTGCFSDPSSPPAQGTTSSDESSSTVAETANSADTGVASSSSEGSTSASTSTGGAGTSTTGTSTGGDGCFEIDLPEVPVGVVLLVDNNWAGEASLVMQVNEGIDPGAAVAILIPEGMSAPIELGCDSCGLCSFPNNRLVIPYTGDASTALEDFMSYGCVFGPELMPRFRQVWAFTDNPEWPANAISSVQNTLEQREARLNVTCPECSDETVGSLLDVARATLGIVSSSSPNAVELAAIAVSGPRHSCRWPLKEEFDVLELLTDNEVVYAESADGILSCGGGALRYYVDSTPEEDFVELCPLTCAVLQTYPAQYVTVSGCSE
jgi:hypothetical protein